MKKETVKAESVRRVVIATPTHAGTVSVGYAYSLAETRLVCAANNIEVLPVLLEGALVEDSRNQLIAIFKRSGADDLVFIDSDISWASADFLKLLNHKAHAVGATYRHKTDEVSSFVVRTKDGKTPKAGKDGLMPVMALGCGFLKLSRTAVDILWKKSKRYLVRGEEVRQVCEVKVAGGELLSEDTSLCLKLPQVLLDPTIMLVHTGEKNFTGSAVEWFKAVDRLVKTKE